LPEIRTTATVAPSIGIREPAVRGGTAPLPCTGGDEMKRKRLGGFGCGAHAHEEDWDVPCAGGCGCPVAKKTAGCNEVITNKLKKKHC
jgi:hypothetical protein